MLTCSNDYGSITIARRGATWISWQIPFQGSTELLIPPEDVTNNPDYRGAFVGPFAGRIGSPGDITLHGGMDGYSLRDWTLERLSDGIRATLDDITVDYHLVEQGVRIDIQAKPKQPTRLNLTTHPYFRLANRVDEVKLFIPAEQMVETKHNLGVGIKPVPEEINFQTIRQVGETELDYCYLASELTAQGSEITLNMKTSYPSVVVYSYNCPAVGETRLGLAIEPQYPLNYFHYSDESLIFDNLNPYFASIDWHWSPTYGND